MEQYKKPLMTSEIMILITGFKFSFKILHVLYNVSITYQFITFLVYFRLFLDHILAFCDSEGWKRTSKIQVNSIHFKQAFVYVIFLSFVECFSWNVNRKYHFHCIIEWKKWKMYHHFSLLKKNNITIYFHNT